MRRTAARKTPGPLVEIPVDGLEVGRDEKGAVGPYETPNAYGGKIQSVRIEVGD